MILRDEKREQAYSARYDGTGKTKRHVVIYSESGLPGVERHLREAPKAWRYEHSRTSGASADWDRSAGYEGACKLAKDGWSEGAQMLDAKLGAIIPAAGRSSRWGYSQTGGSVNIGRFLTGHPKNMRSRTKKQAGSAPVYHIVINTVCSAAITANQMVNYGVAMVGLIDRLENTGKRVQLDVVMVTKTTGEDSNTRLSVGWNVKRSSEALDLAAVAFALAHPAAFRRLGFALMERSPKECASSGYGRCLDAHWSDVPDADEATMVIDGIQHAPSRCNTPQDALRLCIEQVNKAAVLAGHCQPGGEPLIDEDDYLFDD